MNLNENKIWEKIKFHFKKKGKTFQDLSENTNAQGPKYCVYSKEKAISGDNLKLNCCVNNNSVDAISISNNYKICLIEFKTKTTRNAQELNLRKDLIDKFNGSLNCFFHNFDQERITNLNVFERYCFISFSNKPREWNNIRGITKNMTKKEKKMFSIYSASMFDTEIDKFKMHDYFYK